MATNTTTVNPEAACTAIHCDKACQLTIILQVTGEFLRGQDKLPCSLTGTWDKELSVAMPNGTKRKIWQIRSMPKAESR